MRRIIIFGNSSSGKSTLARRLAAEEGLAHLDLDPLAWLPTEPPQRRPLDEAWVEIEAFIQAHEAWVIEGCYADLLERAAPLASEAIYLDLPIERCVEHARGRPWEPHKYPSKAAQDARLEGLIAWIRAYAAREGPLSKRAHDALYAQLSGAKRVYRAPEEIPPPSRAPTR